MNIYRSKPWLAACVGAMVLMAGGACAEPEEGVSPMGDAGEVSGDAGDISGEGEDSTGGEGEAPDGESAAGDTTPPPGEDVADDGDTAPDGDTGPEEVEEVEDGPLCAEGAYWDEGVGACQGWTACVPGEYVAREGDVTQDRGCAPCDEGYFSDTENAAHCEAWRDCAPGEYRLAAPTADRDACEPCAPGTAQDEINADSCTPCSDGTFSAEPGQTACVPWQVCGEGAFEVAGPGGGGSATQDRVCAGDFVLIPAAGEASLSGSPEGEWGRHPDEGRRVVRFTRSFYLKSTLTTQADWEAVMGHNPSTYLQCGPACPVESISWYDAVLYLNALSEAEALPQCYALTGCEGGEAPCEVGLAAGFSDILACEGYRFPTEAEWEFAARGGTVGSSYAGDVVGEEGAAEILDPIAWYGGHAGQGTERVAQKAPNAYGLYDTLGLVWEWTEDGYVANLGAAEVVDPVMGAMGPEASPYRVLKGADRLSPPHRVRVGIRNHSVPTNRNARQGLRPARSVIE